MVYFRLQKSRMRQRTNDIVFMRSRDKFRKAAFFAPVVYSPRFWTGLSPVTWVQTRSKLIIKVDSENVFLFIFVSVVVGDGEEPAITEREDTLRACTYLGTIYVGNLYQQQRATPMPRHHLSNLAKKNWSASPHVEVDEFH